MSLNLYPRKRLFYFWLALSLSPLLCAGENPLEGIFSAANLAKAKTAGVRVSPGSRPDTVVLKFTPGPMPASVTLPVPAAAADWTKCRAFIFPFTSHLAIRWDLSINNRKGENFRYGVFPLPDVPVKAVIDGSFLTREFMNARLFRGYWLFNWDNHIDLTQVDSLTISMSPDREVSLELGPLALSSQPASEEILLDHPVVDQFGQWKTIDWPGKIRSEAELKAAWAREDKELAKGEKYPMTELGGWTARKEKATGFFHTAQVDGRWWFVDPEGNLFFSVGQNEIRLHNRTPLKGREKLFEKLPAGSTNAADFYQANSIMRYGETELMPNWKTKAYQRLHYWGFNTVGNWSDPTFQQDPKMPFVMTAGIGHWAKNWEGFPDAYSEEYVRQTEKDAVEKCGPYRNQRYLVGYFVGNEPHWTHRDLIGRILSDPQPTATQTFVRNFLKDRGDTHATRLALLETISRQYFSTMCNAIRKADPNHLLLGHRFDVTILGEVDPAMEAKYRLVVGLRSTNDVEAVIRASDVFDVFSMNIYGYQPPPERILQISEQLKKPIMLTEFHTGTAERGYAPALIMVKNQAERGVAYQFYVEQSAALPPVIGTHHFAWCDEPVTSRGDGENFNFGFVDQLDVPFADLLPFAKQTHRRVYAVHAGQTKPSERVAKAY